MEKRKREAWAREQCHNEFLSDHDDDHSVAPVILHGLERVGGNIEGPPQNARIAVGPVAKSVDCEPPNPLLQRLTTTITGRSQDPTSEPEDAIYIPPRDHFSQLESALEPSRSFQVQQISAQNMI